MLVQCSKRKLSENRLFCCHRAWPRPGRALLHELGHSVVALHYKVPVSSITLFIFGGVAQIEAESPSASAEFWIALAGPVVSFAFSLFFGLLQIIVTLLAPLLAVGEYLAHING